MSQLRRIQLYGNKLTGAIPVEIGKLTGLKLQKAIFNKYIYKRQTLQDLTDEYKRSISWVKKQIFEYEPTYKTHNPRAVNLICDATFYGKRKDKLGTLVFKDSLSKEVLI